MSKRGTLRKDRLILDHSFQEYSHGLEGMAVRPSNYGGESLWLKVIVSTARKHKRQRNSVVLLGDLTLLKKMWPCWRKWVIVGVALRHPVLKLLSV